MILMQRSLLSVFALHLLVVAVGCGGAPDGKATAKAGGKVTANGQAVPGGTISLQPLGSGSSGVGKPASGQIQSDGSFKLTTYVADDGAVLGKHRVSFAPPPAQAAEVPAGGHAAAPQKGPFDDLVPQTPEVEIKAGENNELKIELVPKPAS